MAKKVTERIISVNTQGAENSIKALREQIKSLTAVQKELDIESEDFAHITQELTAAQTQLRNAVQGNTAAVEGSYKAYSHQLQVLKEQRKWMREGTEEYIRATQEIGKLDTKLKQMDAEIGVYGRNVGNYASAFDGLTGSVQNVVKELPVLGKGTSDFFTATKESLPTLFESIEGFKEMSKETGGATSTIGAMLKSMLSWQTVAIVVVSLLAEYGDEIVAWVKNLNTAQKKLDDTTKAQREFAAEVEESGLGIGDLVVQILNLAEGYRAVGDSLDEKKKFILDNADAMNELGIATGDVVRADAILVKYTDKYIEAMKARAQATAAAKLAGEAYETYLKLQVQRDQKQAEADEMPDYVSVTLTPGYKGVNAANQVVNTDKNILKEEIRNIDKQMTESLTMFEVFFKMQGNFGQQANDILADIGALGGGGSSSLDSGTRTTSSTQSSKMNAAGMYENSWGGGMAIGSLSSMAEGIDQSSAIEAQKARLAAMVQMERASAEERKTIEQNLDSELAIIEEARLTAHEIVLRDMLRSDELSAEERLDIEQQLTDNQIAQIELRMDAEKKAEAEKEALAKKRVTIEQQTTNAVSNILKASAGMMEENSKEQKALSAAALLVDTYASAMSGWRAGMQIGGVAGPIVAGINVAASLAMGALQLKNLLDVREDGSNATQVNASVPNVASTMPAAYTRNLMGDSELSELNKDTRVYVVESDITEAQNASRVRVESASF